MGGFIAVTFNKRTLRQRAIYWSNPSNSGGTGDFTYDSPIEIRCRWEQKRELFIDENGVENYSRAIIYVDQDVELQGFIMEGQLVDLDSSGESPHDQDDAFQIKLFEKSSNLQNTKVVRKVTI